MPDYDLVIKGGTVIDGLRTPRYRADIAIKDGRIVQIGSVAATDGAEVVDASGKIVAPGLRRSAHALRQPGLLGSVVHDVGLARRHERRHRQLRVRLRAVPAGGSRSGDAEPVPQRSGAAEDDAGRHAVGLGDVPAVPRQRGPHAQGRQRDGVRAARAALHVRRGRRQGEGVPGHRRRARRDVPAAHRGPGSGRVRVERPDRGRGRQRAARLRRHADGDRRDDRPRGRGVLPRARRRSVEGSSS